jgi:hypothetical protein
MKAFVLFCDRCLRAAARSQEGYLNNCSYRYAENNLFVISHAASDLLADWRSF